MNETTRTTTMFLFCMLAMACSRTGTESTGGTGAGGGETTGTGGATTDTGTTTYSCDAVTVYCGCAIADDCCEPGYDSLSAHCSSATEGKYVYPYLCTGADLAKCVTVETTAIDCGWITDGVLFCCDYE